MTCWLEHGDMREVLPRLLAEKIQIDAIVTDPPYHLTAGKKGGTGPTSRNVNSPAGRARISTGFMGKAWDGGDIAFQPETWRLCYELLPPGGHLLAFCGTRTYHRMACAIEDAGFEIRDSIAWLYGSGFPKSLNVSKAIDKAKGAERPVLATGDPVKRMIPGADQNKAGWEKNNGREFVPSVTAAASIASAAWKGWGTALKPAMELIVVARKPLIGTVAANVLEHETGVINIDGCRVPYASQADETETKLKNAHTKFDSGPMTNQVYGKFDKDREDYDPPARWPANVVHDSSAEVLAGFPDTGISSGGKGAASQRTALAGHVYGSYSGATLGKNAGSLGDSRSAARFFYSAKAGKKNRRDSKHPTVKPVKLMQWLVRLVTPPGGVVLDPFSGSGTTGEACELEGFDCVLVEREDEYVADIRRRLPDVQVETTTT